ncbi:MAG: outer membrane beta-barrel family protein, partial [Cyclobacteriaceae bacterium]|nr:outer membrane beta-barrel family protein [Cyclobacteriaceae bacterium]
GETIQQVLLDGKRFFGQDPLLSLNTIPADVVKKIEVFDQQSEQSQLTGFNDGNTSKTMNVVTKEDRRNGKFGNFYGGYGTENLYKAGGNLNSFKGDTRITLIGMSNNINQQNFSTEDLAGIGGSSNRGFRRGGNQDFMTGVQNGITKTNSLGANISKSWGKKVTLEGSYFFNATDNSNNQFSNRESFLETGSQNYIEDKNSSKDNLNHRLNMRITLDLNTNNKLIIRPSLSLQDNNSFDYTLGESYDANNLLLNKTENNYSSDNLASNFSNSLLFQHKFEKIGRTLSVDIDTRLRNTVRKNYFEEFILDSLTEYLTNDLQYTLGTTVTYTEPVGKTSQLSASYGVNYTDRDSDRETYQTDIEKTNKLFLPTLSNNFSSGYTTHLPSLFLSNRKFGNFYNLGFSFQHARLNNVQEFPEINNFNRRFNNVLPTFMGHFTFKDGGRMFVRYATSTNEPSVEQLQNVLDNSNPIFLSIGNPDLGQSYSHSLMMRLSKSNQEKNRSISNFIRAQMTNNYITNASNFIKADSIFEGNILVQRGAQILQPINMKGYWNLSNNTTYSFLIPQIKMNLNTTLGIGFTRQPGEANGVKNLSNYYSGNGRISLVSNFSEKVDFNIYYNTSANKVTNEIQTNLNSTYYIRTVGAKANLMFWKGFVFRNDIFLENYHGISADFDTQYILWNMSLAKKFLKNETGELEFSVFDLLGQNQSFSQNINPNFIEEIRTQVLQQYFMLTFTYQFKRFN